MLPFGEHLWSMHAAWGSNGPQATQHDQQFGDPSTAQYDCPQQRITIDAPDQPDGVAASQKVDAGYSVTTPGASLQVDAYDDAYHDLTLSNAQVPASAEPAEHLPRQCGLPWR